MLLFFVIVSFIIFFLSWWSRLWVQSATWDPRGHLKRVNSLCPCIFSFSVRLLWTICNLLIWIYCSITSPSVQVLDLGFNLLRGIPTDAFDGVKSLTLLALDGNPMSTVPEQPFKHLQAQIHQPMNIGPNSRSDKTNTRKIDI